VNGIFRSLTVFSFLFFISALLVSCGGGSGGGGLPKTDEVVPIVTSVSPVNGQLDVAVTDNISITFNENITNYDTSSIVIQKYKVDGTTDTPLVDPILTPNGIKYKSSTNTLSFTPKADALELNSKYHILIRNIEDKATNTMAEKSWDFSTITNPTAKIKPADGYRGISPASNILIEFSEPMDINTLMQVSVNNNSEQNPNNFTLTEAGSKMPNENILFTYDAQSNIASYKIKPTTSTPNGFKKSTSYTVVLSTLVTDANNIRLLSENSSTFTTGFNIGTGTPPTAPKTVSVTTNNGNANITWDVVTGNNVTYNLYSTTDNWLTQTPISQDITGQNTQTPINPDTPYKFGISAVEDNNESLIRSSTEVIYVLVPISPPRNVKAVVGDAEVTLTWSAPSNSTGLKFNVYLSKDNKKPYQKIATKLTGTNYYQLIANNAQYHFAVTSIDAVDKESIKVFAHNNISFTPLAKGTKIAAWNHTCVIRDNGQNQNAGSLWCWGKNKYGQLGIGTKTPAEKPVQVGTVPVGSKLPIQIWNDWIAVSVGAEHSCGIRKVNGAEPGLLYCWGNNTLGQLGLGSIPVTKDITIPQLVKNPTLLTGITINWTQVSLGPYHSCAIHSSAVMKGELFCWGLNNSGELGNAQSGLTPPNVLQPEPVAGKNGINAPYKDWIEISSGSGNTCGIRQESTTNTTLWCWGNRGGGQIGDNNPTSTVTNVFIPSQEYNHWTDWTSISTGLGHSCAIRSKSNSLWCWGDNWYKQLGRPTTDPISYVMLQENSNANDWIKVFANSYNTCGLKSSGLIECWGRNDFRQIGEYLSEFGVPTTTLTGNTWSEIAIGITHSCSLKLSNTTYCWGSAERYRLGNTTAETASPVRVIEDRNGTYLFGVTDISVTKHTYDYQLSGSFDLGNHAIALQPTSNSLYAWGNNGVGQSGIQFFNKPNNYRAVLIDDTQVWKKPSVALEYSCALLATDDTLWCWGTSSFVNSPNKRVQIGKEKWRAISISKTHICGIKLVVDTTGTPLADDQSLWCWGRNDAGQLGIGTNTLTKLMTKVLSPLATPVKWLSVEVVNNTSCGITTTNDLYCWGANNKALLGNGSFTNSSVLGKSKPNPVLSPKQPVATKWKKISIGNEFGVACGLTLSPVSGELYCWGTSSFGQAGQPSNVNGIITSPLLVPNYNWTDFDVGATHTCAINSVDSSLWCWGNNAYGQLGNGVFDNDPTDFKANNLPVKVVTNIGVTDTWSKVATGGEYTCAIDSASTILFCWGRNTHGQLGNTSAWTLPPVAVTIP